jgi:hypothetical protein
MRAEKRRAQIDVEHSAPVGGGQAGERTLLIHRRHVEQDVEAAEFVGDRFHERRARVRLREVRLERRAPPLGRAHALDDRLGLGT